MGQIVTFANFDGAIARLMLKIERCLIESRLGGIDSRQAYADEEGRQMTLAQAAALSVRIDPRVPWHADWAWGVPLIVLTVIFHVFGLGLIRQQMLPIYREFMKRHHPTAAFTVVMGATALLATVLHGLEAAIWAGAYYLIGALPDLKYGMLYSLSAMTTYGHENFDLEAHWQLLGAIEALNGLLLFGLTTAFLFGMMEKVMPANRPGR